MKVKEGFLLREVAGSWIVVPIGQRVVEFNGLMSLSESGALLWKGLEAGVEDEEELVNILIKEYDIDIITAQKDIKAFLCSVREEGLID